VKVGKQVIARADLAPDLYALPIAELERRYPLGKPRGAIQ
jgi:hypothetical protein